MEKFEELTGLHNVSISWKLSFALDPFSHVVSLKSKFYRHAGKYIFIHLVSLYVLQCWECLFQRKSSSSSGSCNWIEVPTIEPSSPKAQRMEPAPGMACCSCTCAHYWEPVHLCYTRWSKQTVKLRGVPTSTCYYIDKFSGPKPCSDPNASKSLMFVCFQVCM